MLFLLIQYTFEAYELEFAKNYETVAARSARKAAFAVTLAKIKAHNL